MANRQIKIIFEADTTYAGVFWDEDGFCEIGDLQNIDLGDGNIVKLPVIQGLKEWHEKADIYDPYSSVVDFQIEGYEEWVNEGYRLAKQILPLLPDYVSLYYGFWHNFGDGIWRYCKSLITK